MSHELLINAAIGETRLALMEDGEAQEIRLYRDHKPSLVGAIYLGRILSLSSELQAAFVDLGQKLTGFLPLSFLPKQPGKKPKDLTTLLHEGQKIIVQVTGDAEDGKSLKLTGRVEIKSASIILHPYREGAFVSSRIKNPARREALKIFGMELDLKGLGLTFRTEAENIPDNILEKTAKNLIGHWLRVQNPQKGQKIPCLISQNPEPIHQILRDYASPALDKIILDQPATLKKAQGWAQEFAPDLLPRIEAHTGRESLFDQGGVNEALDQVLDAKIPLSSGAWISFEQTEALCVVDVNSGSAAQTTDHARHILGVNLQAAHEIFRQIRLRGTGGLIVIDFINMSGKGHVTQLLDVIDSLMLKDPQQIQRSNISSFGLLELARKSSHASLSQQMIQKNIPHTTVATLALDLLRKAEGDACAKPGIALRVKTSQPVKDWLDKQPHLMQEFTRRTGSALTLLTE